MPQQLNITASCAIKGNSVIENGKVVFEQSDAKTEQFFSSLYKRLDIIYPKFYKMDNLSKLGFLASETLLQNNFEKDRYAAEEVGVVLSNASSSLDADIKYWKSAQDIASPALFVYTLPNIVIGEIAIRNGFKGEHAFYVMPDFDTAFIHRQVKYLLDNKLINACICGWVEALGNDYDARLFLVEGKEAGVAFEVGNLS